MEQWLFETPWWLLSAIAVAAVALLVSGNNRQDRQLKLAGAAVLAAGAGLWAVSWFVETPRETCVRQTREWVAAVVAKDATVLGSMLHPKAALAAWDRQDILEGAVKYADIYGLRGATIISMNTQPSPSVVKVGVSVISRHDANMAMFDTIPSTWELNWMKTDNRWEIKDIIPVRIGQSDRASFRDSLFGSSPR